MIAATVAARYNKLKRTLYILEGVIIHLLVDELKFVNRVGLDLV